jgi:hypothetical protein
MTESQQVEKLKDALNWYAEQAMKMNAYVLAMNQISMMEVMQALALDNGKRARAATEA